MKIGKCKLKTGFTLMEVLLVLAIVGIMISGILPLFLNVITATKSAAYYSIAYKVADSKIEEYRSQSFDSIEDETFDIAELPGAGGTIGTGTLVIDNEIEGSPQADILELNLTIDWDFKRPQQINVVTYVARDGL